MLSGLFALSIADSEHPPIKVGEFSEKIALVRAEDDEGLEDEYAVRKLTANRKYSSSCKL